MTIHINESTLDKVLAEINCNYKLAASFTEKAMSAENMELKERYDYQANSYQSVAMGMVCALSVLLYESDKALCYQDSIGYYVK